MKIKDFAKAAADKLMIVVKKNGEVLASFDVKLWGSILDDILDLEVETFTIENVIFGPPCVTITAAADEDEDNEEQ